MRCRRAQKFRVLLNRSLSVNLPEALSEFEQSVHCSVVRASLGRRTVYDRTLATSPACWGKSLAEGYERLNKWQLVVANRSGPFLNVRGTTSCIKASCPVSDELYDDRWLTVFTCTYSAYVAHLHCIQSPQLRFKIWADRQTYKACFCFVTPVRQPRPDLYVVVMPLRFLRAGPRFGATVEAVFVGTLLQ